MITDMKQGMRQIRKGIAKDVKALDLLMELVGGLKLDNKRLADLFRAQTEWALNNYVRQRNRKAKKAGE